jgi:hypothetical protein
MSAAFRGPQFLLYSHDGYQRIHRDVDVIAEANFTCDIPRPLGNRLRRSKSDAALAQALFVISETAIKGGGNASAPRATVCPAVNPGHDDLSRSFLPSAADL